MTDNSLSKIPHWDGKAENFGVYVSKIEAYAEFMGVRDVLDPVLMANCLTKSEFAEIDITNPTNMPLVNCAKETVCYYCTGAGQESWNCSVGEDKKR